MRIAPPEIPDRKVSLLDYAAVPDGICSNTLAFRNAVQALAEQGGGHLLVPKGIYRTGPIRLLDRIDLHLEQGAIVLFEKNKEEYPLEISDYEGIRCIRARSPIYAKDARDISVTGRGIINGSGELWRPCKEWKFTAREWGERKKLSPASCFETEEGELWYPSETSFAGAAREEPSLEALGEERALREAAPYYDFYRPCMVRFERCERVLLEGVSFLNSPAWGVHFWFCRQLSVRDCYFRNDDFAQNGDGLDVESCEYVEIRDSLFDTGDDAICLKAGKNREARRQYGPTAHVRVCGCRVMNGHGGFVIGSEMSRGVLDVEVCDCDFIGTDTGIRVKTALGRGGAVRNIKVHDIRMAGIRREAVLLTAEYRLYSRSGADPYDGKMTDEEDVPELCELHFSGIVASGAECGICIEGLSLKPIHDVSVENSVFECEVPVRLLNGRNIRLEKVCFWDRRREKRMEIKQKVLEDGIAF